jgi:hypothetical protein
VRSVDHTSLVIVLATGGSPLERTALEALADVVVARVRHADPPEDFRERIRHWAAARGWAVTVAPDGPRR